MASARAAQSGRRRTGGYRPRTDPTHRIRGRTGSGRGRHDGPGDSSSQRHPLQRRRAVRECADGAPRLCDHAAHGARSAEHHRGGATRPGGRIVARSLHSLRNALLCDPRTWPGATRQRVERHQRQRGSRGQCVRQGPHRRALRLRPPRPAGRAPGRWHRPHWPCRPPRVRSRCRRSRRRPGPASRPCP